MSREGAAGDGASTRDCARFAVLGLAGLAGTASSIALGLVAAPVRLRELLRVPLVVPGPRGASTRSAAMFEACATRCDMMQFVSAVGRTFRI